MSITQGGQYNSGKIGIIEQGFKSANSEGFVGILGSNYDMDQVINTDTATTIAGTTRLNDNDRQYGQSYKTLRVKTNEYVDALPANRLKQNYNVFVNKSVSPYEIPEQNHKKCVTASSISNLTLADGFATSYPDSLTNYNDAKIACKFWAANAGKTTFAVNRNLNGKYQCYIGNGLNSTITEKFKPGKIYTVLAGDNTSTKGGLFFNGQIGVYTGPTTADPDPDWDISNMMPAKLLVKYNDIPSAYSDGPQGDPEMKGSNNNFVNWGKMQFPNDNAWWISSNESRFYGFDSLLGYFFYIYNSPVAKNIKVYTFVNRSCELKVNGEKLNFSGHVPRDEGLGGIFDVKLKAGNNVFEYKLLGSNQGAVGGFGLYGYEPQNNNKVLFMSGPDWGYKMTPAPNYNLVTRSTSKFLIDPMNMKALNPAPAGYEKCHSLMGGGIMKQSIKATYGKNCSDSTIRPTNIRYIKITPNARGDIIQINQIVVNALLPDGRIMNVADKGTVTVPPDDYDDPKKVIDGVLTPKESYHLGYHSAYYFDTTKRLWLGKPNRFLQLDLGKDYLATEVVYYNRYDCCRERSIGMIIQLTASDGTAQKPIILNDSYIQSFKFPIT